MRHEVRVFIAPGRPTSSERESFGKCHAKFYTISCIFLCTCCFLRCLLCRSFIDGDKALEHLRSAFSFARRRAVQEQKYGFCQSVSRPTFPKVTITGARVHIVSPFQTQNVAPASRRCSTRFADGERRFSECLCSVK